MADGQSLSSREGLFTLARGYRKPLMVRGLRALVFAVLLAFIGSFGIVPVMTWTIAAVFGASALLFPGSTRAVSCRDGPGQPGLRHVRGSGRLGRPRQRNSTGGYRGKLLAVRAARPSGHSLLLRAPLVTAWQSDSQFDEKVRVINQWWDAYGKGTAGDASG
jgi:hypothetical protein